MSKIVFILGAGASCEDGAPLMNAFMTRARNLYENNDILVSKHRDHFSNALALYDSLESLKTMTRSEDDNPKKDIETVLALLEASQVIGYLPTTKFGQGWIPDDSQSIENLTPTQLKESFTTLIIKTLEASIEFPLICDAREQTIMPTKTYLSFAKLLKRLLDEKHEISIITTNYDLMLEVALWRTGLCFIDLSGRVGREYSTVTQPIHIHKLHGSLNWCKEGEKLKAVKIDNLLRPIKFKLEPRETPHDVRLPFSVILGTLPYIVPPLPSKSGHFSHIENSEIWKGAATDLGRANQIILCGYSWPKSDYCFDSFYRLGVLGNTRLEKFSVYDVNPELEEKFSTLFGHWGERYKFTVCSFSDMIESM